VASEPKSYLLNPKSLFSSPMIAPVMKRLKFFPGQFQFLPEFFAYVDEDKQSLSSSCQGIWQKVMIDTSRQSDFALLAEVKV
jgi:hypothetical protein